MIEAITIIGKVLVVALQVIKILLERGDKRNVKEKVGTINEISKAIASNNHERIDAILYNLSSKSHHVSAERRKNVDA